MNRFKHQVLLLVLFVSATASFASSLTEEQINKLQRSIVKIKVNGKVGTGFIYQDSRYAVTAFHVIAGTNGTVSVQYPSLGPQTYVGHVIRTLKRADLALIEIQGFRNVSPLRASTNNPAFNTAFTTIGFLWDANGTHSKDIIKRETKVLDTFIPSSTRADVQNAQCPSLDLSVYSFEGNPLVPGYSGAPIFHNDEGIIGISDGGIKQGIASVSWGIPAAQLAVLMNSNEYAAGSHIATQSHFSADVVENPNYSTQVIALQNRVFHKVRTEVLSNIMNATDDVNGLVQLLNTFPPQISRNIRFDVYQNFESGATFIVPQGFTLRNHYDRVEVVAPDNGSTLTIKGVSLPNSNIYAMQYTSAQLESSAFDPLIIPGFSWNVDQGFTYINPLIRPDGFWARRKSFYQLKPATQFAPVQFGMHGFEAFVYKKDFMIQLYTVNTNFNSDYLMQRLPCDNNGFQGQGCRVILGQLQNWMALIAATHFATFSQE
jgi:hypothetical protein